MQKQIYLIIDAEIPLAKLQSELNPILKDLDKVQLYNTEKISIKNLQKCIFWWLENTDAQIFIYENKKALSLSEQVGIHLDAPEDLVDLEQKLNRKITKGCTVGNDLETLKNAEKYGFSYISFCSVFPTQSANVCELVKFENIEKARELFSGEIFLAGGINPQTRKKLKNIDFDGVAIISALMESNDKKATIASLK
ncbi:thiamine phosphate synthase [Ornithobacterium rhinotracheale]|uniref:thiamine phosphate synthase n=1 Tax=Ornithobacterium rhinotracheale TaxID=28251 RepID=UPI00129CED31|nr:thiamine phosphate synthase [Ornithobacterium rhinotracheale]MRJ08704.1 thiamine phosphate synthase [Ornithobacterium rhinotracheale]UOH77152.1 thiamine phosphate synthase [Ornithobacterium rhinotracheale]